jgi:hypothetical protein
MLPRGREVDELRCSPPLAGTGALEFPGAGGFGDWSHSWVVATTRRSGQARRVQGRDKVSARRDWFTCDHRRATCHVRYIPTGSLLPKPPDSPVRLPAISPRSHTRASCRPYTRVHALPPPRLLEVPRRRSKLRPGTYAGVHCSIRLARRRRSRGR